MKKLIIVLVIIFTCFAGCDYTSETERGLETIDLTKPYLAISVSFNPSAYEAGILYPQFAIWLEYENNDGELDYQTAFVTQGTGKNQWVWFGGYLVRRPEATPVWSGVREKEIDMDIDAVSGATPVGSLFTVYCQVPDNLNGNLINVYSEVNISFDVNLYYPNPINGQPSLIWNTELDLSEMTDTQSVDAEIIGHGNSLGLNHDIYDDTTEIVSAKKLFHFVQATYFDGEA